MKPIFVVPLVIVWMSSCVSREWIKPSLISEYESSMQSMLHHLGKPAETFSIDTLQGYPGNHDGYRYFFIGTDGELRCHEIMFRGGIWRTAFLMGPSAYEHKGSGSLLEDKVRLRVLTKQELSDPRMQARVERLLPEYRSGKVGCQ